MKSPPSCERCRGVPSVTGPRLFGQNLHFFPGNRTGARGASGAMLVGLQPRLGEKDAGGKRNSPAARSGTAQTALKSTGATQEF